MSVHPSAWDNWAPNERILMNFGGGVFFENLSSELKFHKNLTRITDILLEDLLRFMMLSRRNFLRTTIVLHRIYREDQNTGFMSSNFFSPENPAICEIKWKNIVEPDRSRMKIWCILIECWIPKAKNLLRICNTYCVFITTMVTPTSLNTTS
jgi:uncharacterized protein YqgQ